MRRVSRSFVAWCLGAALLAPALQLAALVVPFSGGWLFVIAVCVGSATCLLSGALAFADWSMRERTEPRRKRLPPLAVGALAFVFLLSFGGSFVLRVPYRICIAMSERALADAARVAAEKRWSEESLFPPRAWESEPERVGWLPVYRTVVTPDGAAWYVLDEHFFFIDLTTVGLVHGALDRCTPFGGSGFMSVDLGNGWHWFSVNDDWHC